MADPAKKASALVRPLKNPFRLGSRSRWVSLPGRTQEKRLIPLRARDLLNPQEGDFEVRTTWHIDIVHALFEMLNWRYGADPDVLVSSDLKILWGIPGLAEPAPDVVLISGVHDKEKLRPSFSVQEERTRPALCIEVGSHEPEIRRNDFVEKVRIYQQAGVREYLILDPSYHTGDPFWTGYRLDLGGRYHPIAPDAEGRLYSETTGLWFGIDPDRRALRIIDAVTGERLQTSEEARTAAQAAEAELARLREEIRRLKGSTPG